MVQKISEEKEVLLQLLGQSLQKEDINKRVEPKLSKQQWQQLVWMAEKHAVLPLLYDQLKGCRTLEVGLWKHVEQISRQTVWKNYRLMFLDKYITELLKENGITAITLKGAITASLYPVPELRKSGDIDILVLDSVKHEKACRILQENGFYRKGEQKIIHHMELENQEKISVELHALLAEPFESQRINSYLEQILPQYEKTCQVNSYWGVELFEPSDICHAFYLIIHMLQHFLRAGFGLKYLCDWVVFWNREVEQDKKEQFKKMAEESGTTGFVTVLTAVCIRYLGLQPKNASHLMVRQVSEAEIDEFMEEIFEAEEFGRSKNNRMVAMRDTSLAAYAKEFHHQMHLNYPKVGRIIPAWPFVWILTLFRFIYNNHRIRNISSMDVLKKAGKRSRLIKNMNLFQ